jgi:hypothetical protein
MGAGVPFIDVGMGLKKRDAGLTGSMRTTVFLPDRAAAVRAQNYASEADEPENEYRRNIQIAELNALNSALAVIRYKQLRGFYRTDIPADQHLFNIAEMKTYEESPG